MGALSEIHRAGSDTIQSNSDIPAALPTPLIRSIGAQSGTLRLSARLSQGSEGAFLNKNVRRYFWFQIVMGWVLTTLFVAGFTGIVRRE